mmetsp:Transcript_29043/g.55738  ORF Transcript_29043/g.55738 Transcript_29043/m.55738 type:complete len:280 (-) Transcript_29043:193-1032(-)
MCSQLISSSICPTSCLLTREKQYMPSICNTSCRRHVYSSTTGCCCRMSICNCLERDVLRLYETHWISSGSDKQGMSMAKIHLSRIASKSCQLLEHALHRLLGGSQLYPFNGVAAGVHLKLQSLLHHLRIVQVCGSADVYGGRDLLSHRSRFCVVPCSVRIHARHALLLHLSCLRGCDLVLVPASVLGDPGLRRLHVDALHQIVHYVFDLLQEVVVLLHACKVFLTFVIHIRDAFTYGHLSFREHLVATNRDSFLWRVQVEMIECRRYQVFTASRTLPTL